ncbi:carotenoid biosynthesis protein [Catalinimonas niigatensis]|uniref:carotenoid biosynthesis protein n=1 Tax=Catalinimonas niigatensis TaxID=1397264 RepID=UPI0026665957|nr:carotenoid biosynthesis protein [Catalinimonas niigatensis]WPP51547.1 carotenoid biosynthesis protein [Catalinimonas niigatensis]
MPISSYKLLMMLDPKNTRHQKIALISIIIIHFFGIIGLVFTPTRPYFEAATPFSLILTSLLLFAFHQDWNIAFILFALVTYILGFMIELVGVQTEFIFGSYTYGITLGTKLWDVPLIIGLNWLLLSYASGSVVRNLSRNIFFNSLAGSVIMVLLDVLIEPVAVRLDFWQWKEGKIPLQNFVGWFVTAFFLQLLFHRLKFDKKNLLAKYVLSVQALFFIILQIAI